jgi:hypothetical protein
MTQPSANLRKKNLTLLAVLLAVVILLFFVSIARISGT